MEKKLDSTQAALNLTDPRDHSHRVENVGGWFVGIVALRHREHETLALERRLDRAQCARSASCNRRGETGKDHRPPEREDGKRLALCHGHDLSGLSNAKSHRPRETRVHDAHDTNPHECASIRTLYSSLGILSLTRCGALGNSESCGNTREDASSRIARARQPGRICNSEPSC